MNEDGNNVFNKVHNLKVRDIKLSCHVSNSDNDILAFVIGSGDLFLYNLAHGKESPILRWLPWFDDIKKKIHALTFSPGSGQWLLISCSDCSLCIVPALALLGLNDYGSENYDWSLEDLTTLSSPMICNVDFIPSAIAWWSRSGYKGELKDIGILGSTHGLIVIFAVLTGNIIVTTKIEGSVCQIEICDQDPNACAIITNEIGHQWRLLFHESLRDQPDQAKSPIMGDARSSKLLGLKQLSVDTIANIKQRINETRSKSISTILPVECSEGDVVRCGPQWQLNVKLQSVSETSLAVHNKIITATYPANIVAVENFQTEANTVHKLPFSGVQLVLTSSLFIFTCEELSKIYLVSQTLSQCRTDSNKHFLNTDFNSESLIQKFLLSKNEVVIKLYCTNFLKNRSVLITNLGIYTLFMSEEPKVVVLKQILSSEHSLHSAEKLSCVFGLDLQQLICEAADIQLTKGLINEATQLYGMSRCGGVRSVVMLAQFGHIPEVMSALSLNNFSQSHKLHLANLKVLAYVHQYLTRYSEELHNDFLEMLNKGGYDESLAVSVLAQAGLCEDLLLITKQRGLQPITIVALANILQHNYPLNIIKCKGFWELISEYTLCEALLAKPRIAKIHLNFIQAHLATLDGEILQNLEELYNPFRTSLRPWITYTCQGEAPISLWVQTYILICIHLSALKKEVKLNMIERIYSPNVNEFNLNKNPVHINAQIIGVGFSHSCVVLHGNAYTWGTTAFGCLGTGPSYPRIIGPTIVDMFPNIGIRVLSVSCGRTHTIVLTNNGVYAWGSNRYGQLGIGNVIQSWFPRSLEFFKNYNIIHISAGQYHSVAIDSDYRVYTWGWGVHGQLGHGNVEDFNMPKSVDSLLGRKIIWSSGGHAHTLFLDVEGKVWACGSSVFGQLGTGANIKSSVPLQVFGLPEKIVNLSTGYFHSVGLAEGGRVYQWGCSPTVLRAAAHAAKRRLRSHEGSEDSNVQLDDNLSYLSPTLVDTSHVTGKIIKVSAGNEHNALLTEAGTIYTWGRNMDGQLGNTASQTQRRSQHVLHPTQITVGTSIKDVECGSDFTVAVDITGNVWTWGANHHSAVNRSALASLEGEVVVVKNRNRVIKLPHSGTNSQPLPTLLSIPTQHNDLPLEIKDKSMNIIINDWESRLHLAIEILYPFYQPSLLIDKCIDLGESNAGAKIAQVSDDLVMAVKLHLQSAHSIEFICEVLYHYLPLVINNVEQIPGFLEYVMRFWSNSSLPMKELEIVLKQYWDHIAKPLGHLLLRISGGMTNIFSQFSTEFNLCLISHMIEHSDGNLECILPGVHDIKDAINAINMSDEFIDIDENMAYESIPYPVNKFSIPENSYASNQGLRKPSLYLK